MTNNHTFSVSLRIFNTFFFAGLLLFLFSFFFRELQAEEANVMAGVARFVSTSGSDGTVDAPNDCTTSSSPCQTVQHAMSVAGDDDEIRVAAGTYSGVMSEFRPEQNRTVTATVIINKKLSALFGGYAPDFATRTPSLHLTTLDAGGAPATFVIYLAGTNTTIDGFSVTGAVGGSSMEGGAIFIAGGAPTIRGNQIHHNQTNRRGAGIYVAAGAPVIAANRIYANTSVRHGGGIFVMGSSAVITGNEILSNVVTTGNGGGVYVLSGTVSIENNVIASNQAISPTTGRGGGIFIGATGGPHTVRRNQIYANQSIDGGSAIESKAPILIENNLIHDNQVSLAGTALLVEGVAPLVTIQNNLVYKNRGGGVTVRNFAEVLIVNNTIDRNSAVSFGGPGNGIDVNGSITPTLSAKATILNNIVTNSGACGVEAYNNVTAEIDYNNIFDNALTYCNQALPPNGSHNIADDARYVDAAAGDYHLARGSQSVDGGTSDHAPIYAIDGSTRPDGNRFDMGVYETTGGLIYLPIVQR